MSTCISRHGEWSDHIPDEEFTCTRCGALDEDGLKAELADARKRLDAVETLVEPLRCIPGEDRGTPICKRHHGYWWPEGQRWCNDMDPDVAAVIRAVSEEGTKVPEGGRDGR